MIRGSLLWRLYVGYGALIILLAGLVAFLVAPRVERSSLREIEAALRTDATLLGELARPYLLDGADPQALQHVISRLGQDIETRLTVVRPDGVVIADSEEDPVNMENHARRPELLDARNRGEGQTRRLSETLGMQMMYFARSVSRNDEVVGLVRASLPLTTIDERLGQIRRTVILATALVTLVALGGGYLFARRITRPLRSMTRAARSLALGVYDEPLPITSTDEIATLSGAFNSMREQLREQLDTIQQDRNKILAIVSSMKEGVIAVDGDQRIVHMNEAAGVTLGVDASACLGERFWEVIRVPEVVDLIRSTLEQSTGRVGEVRLAAARADRWLELETSVLQSAGGQITGAVLVLHDVSELRRLEGVRSDFVSNVSHELKTPVAAIRGLVESILDDPRMDDEVRTRFLERVKKQSGRLSNLVSDLLSLSAIEARQRGVEHHPVDLVRILRTAVAGQATAAEEKGVNLHSLETAAQCSVMGDEEDLRQVFDNLLSNAIRYTPEGGNVRVRQFVGADLAVVEVVDDGIGIEPQHAGRIFERFYRADKARSRELGGTGLGLAIVKHIVLSMGGTISVESVPSEGSVFRVELPSATGLVSQAT